MRSTFRATVLVAAACAAGAAIAKLPPLSEEAKAKAAEATAKTAHGNKLADYKLCQVQDRVAARYHADAKKAGRDAKPAGTAPPCADPGPFVAAPAATPPPLEAAGAHSPPKTATAPPSTNQPAAEQKK